MDGWSSSSIAEEVRRRTAARASTAHDQCRGMMVREHEAKRKKRAADLGIVEPPLKLQNDLDKSPSHVVPHT